MSSEKLQKAIVEDLYLTRFHLIEARDIAYTIKSVIGESDAVKRLIEKLKQVLEFIDERIRVYELE